MSNYKKMQARPLHTRTMTLKDIEAKVDDDILRRNNSHGIYIGKGNSERWGLRCLDLTNEFRRQQGHSPMLEWN